MERGVGEENLGDAGDVELKGFEEVGDDAYKWRLCVTLAC